jgi:lysyl-tRNA synthetase class 2
VALVGAIRLARPSSPWARWRYKPESKKRERAVRRDTTKRTRWVDRRKRVQDALAGRPG